MAHLTNTSAYLTLAHPQFSLAEHSYLTKQVRWLSLCAFDEWQLTLSSRMAWWQFLLFRKKTYRRRVSQENYEKREHKQNIRRKKSQVQKAQWGVCSSLWMMPFSGMLTGVNAVRHTRNLHIATQKLNVLEKEWERRYPGEPIERPKVKKPWIKRFTDGMSKTCGCLCGCVAHDLADIESDIVGDAEGSVLGGGNLGGGESSPSLAGAGDMVDDGMKRAHKASKKAEASEKQESSKKHKTSKSHKSSKARKTHKKHKKSHKEKRKSSDSSSSSPASSDGASGKSTRSNSPTPFVNGINQSVQNQNTNTQAPVTSGNQNAQLMASSGPTTATYGPGTTAYGPAGAAYGSTNTAYGPTSAVYGPPAVAYNGPDYGDVGPDTTDGMFMGATVSMNVNPSEVAGELGLPLFADWT